MLRKRIDRALRDTTVSDILPPALRARWDCLPLENALGACTGRRRAPTKHNWPCNRRQCGERMLFDELLAQQLALREMRAKRGPSG